MRYKRYLTGYFRSLSDIGKRPGLVISEDEELMMVNQDGELEEVSTSGGSQSSRAYTITPADLLAADGLTAATGEGSGGEDGLQTLTITAVTLGIAGNAIAVVFANDHPGGGGTFVSVSVDGLVITVHLIPEVDVPGQVECDAAHIATAINDDPEASALVTAVGATVGAAAGGYSGASEIDLSGGKSRLTLDTFEADQVLWDATPFFPENFDAAVAFQAQVGGYPVFADGDPDPTASVDNDGGGGLFITQSGVTFNSAARMRWEQTVDLILEDITTESGPLPSSGEMWLLMDVRTPVDA